MASTSHSSPTYLVGFSPALGCRPFYFVEPLPGARYCCLCNVVPQTTHLLECLHSFCKPCYDQIVATVPPACPIDGKDFDVEVVRDIVFTPNRLAETKVICQNWKNGCEFVGNVVDMVGHLVTSCRFHVVTCRRCNETVRKDYMLKHYVDGCCEVKKTSDNSIPVWASYAGEQPGGPALMLGLAETAANILSIGGQPTPHCPMKNATKAVGKPSTVEDEGIAVEEADWSARKLSGAAEMLQPEDLHSLSADEEQRLRNSGSNFHEQCTGEVFGGDLQETCEELLSHLPEGISKSSQVGIDVGPSSSPHRDSRLFMIGNRCAYLTAFLPGMNGNMRLYLGMRQRTNKGHVFEKEWHKLVIKCHGHQSQNKPKKCTCIETLFTTDENLERTLGYGGLYAKPLFNIVSCAHVPFGVDDLERRNCVQDGQISVAVETLRFP